MDINNAAVLFIQWGCCIFIMALDCKVKKKRLEKRFLKEKV